MKKRLISIALSMMLILTLTPFKSVFASTTNNEVSILVQNESEILVQSDDYVERIDLKDLNSSEPKLVIENKTTKEVNTITFNNKNRTITSSLTGVTIPVDEIFTTDDANTYLRTSSGDSYTTHKVSYAKLKSIVGDSSTVASLASALVTVMGWAGIPVFTPVAVIIGLLAGVTGFLRNVLEGSPKHGLYVKIKHGKRKITQGRYSYYVDSNTIESIGTY